MSAGDTTELRVALLMGAVLVAFTFAFTFGTSTISHNAWGQSLGNNTTPNVYTADSKPYGLSYGEWTAKWWQWLVSAPTKVNPANDNSGANCAQNQAGPVWFLTGALTGKAERNCVIPSGKAILFTILNSECSYAEYPKLKTESDLRNCAVSQNEGMTHIEAIIDGVSLQTQQMPRVQSPLFPVIFPQNNIFSAAAGPSQSVSDGWYVFLHPLSAGQHNISFKAAQVQFTTSGVNNEAQNIVYHLTVQ